MSVGPGSIADGSVLEITSTTGLLFHPVQPSTATLHSTIDLEEPNTEGTFQITIPEHHRKESNNGEAFPVGMVTLPACGPYQEVNLYLVVSAPLEKQSAQDESTNHEVCCEEGDS